MIYTRPGLQCFGYDYRALRPANDFQINIARHAPSVPTIIPERLKPLSVGVAGAINPNKNVPIKPPTIPTTTFAIHPICASVCIILDAIQPTNPANNKVISKLIK